MESKPTVMVLVAVMGMVVRTSCRWGTCQHCICQHLSCSIGNADKSEPLLTCGSALVLIAIARSATTKRKVVVSKSERLNLADGPRLTPLISRSMSSLGRTGQGSVPR